jgi:hypothetical protein
MKTNPLTPTFTFTNTEHVLDSVESAYMKQAVLSRISTPSPYVRFMMYAKKPLTVALVGVLLCTSSAGAAVVSAQKALPGEYLYTIKKTTEAYEVYRAGTLSDEALVAKKHVLARLAEEKELQGTQKMTVETQKELVESLASASLRFTGALLMSDVALDGELPNRIRDIAEVRDAFLENPVGEGDGEGTAHGEVRHFLEEQEYIMDDILHTGTALQQERLFERSDELILAKDTGRE